MLFVLTKFVIKFFILYLQYICIFAVFLMVVGIEIYIVVWNLRIFQLKQQFQLVRKTCQYSDDEKIRVLPSKWLFCKGLEN